MRAGWFYRKNMKINPNALDADELETQNFVKIGSKKQKLKGRQTVTQLIKAMNPNTKFENADLNQLSKIGLLDELLSGIKTGKEGSVFLGRNSDGFVAVKIYTDLRVRSFKRDEMYREGRFIGDARIEKAIQQGSEKGLDAHQILWVQEEFRQMKHLHDYGIRVPKAVAVSGLVILMEFIGDENGTPSPRISDLKLDQAEAAEAFRQAVHNLRLIVRSGRVHGDYSTFNLLWRDGQAVVIDFPQVIEFKHNPNAQTLLARDVHSLCKSFLKQGVRADEVKILREVRAG
jgi:RIO kinase 1